MIEENTLAKMAEARVKASRKRETLPTENLLEDTDGLRDLSGTAACNLLVMLTRAVLMTSSQSQGGSRFWHFWCARAAEFCQSCQWCTERHPRCRRWFECGERGTLFSGSAWSLSAESDKDVGFVCTLSRQEERACLMYPGTARHCLAQPTAARTWHSKLLIFFF